MIINRVLHLNATSHSAAISDCLLSENHYLPEPKEHTLSVRLKSKQQLQKNLLLHPENHVHALLIFLCYRILLLPYIFTGWPLSSHDQIPRFFQTF